MPEQWTGDVVAKMHLNRIKTSELAERMGITRAYLKMILNGTKKPVDARERVEDALAKMIEERG